VAGPVVIKKPTTVASRGFLSKLNLTTTSADGVAYYDDQYQSGLSNVLDHCGYLIGGTSGEVKREF